MEKATDREAPLITVVGLGPGDGDLLTLGAVRALQTAGRVFLRTARHPSVSWLDRAGVAYVTFDQVYSEKGTFEEVYDSIVAQLVAEAQKAPAAVDRQVYGGIVYAVPGHPTLAEASVQKLLNHPSVKAGEVAVRLLPAVSAIDAVSARLSIDPMAESIMVADAADPRLLAVKAAHAVRSGSGLLVLQVYDRMVASEAKLALMDVYADETPVFVVQAAGADQAERLERVPLFELDRLTWLDHLTSVFIPAPTDGRGVAHRRAAHSDQQGRVSGRLSGRLMGLGELLEELAAIMARLRSESGCPWDRKQTHVSLKRYLVEETYEVLEAIDSGVPAKLCEELGDVLLQVVFHAQLAAEKGVFDLSDVILGISEKLVRRHPHVFGDVKVTGADEVVTNWEAIKRKEHAAERDAGEPEHAVEFDSVLNGIPRGLPALLYAQKTQEKAARVGFDWPEVEPVWDKLREELRELENAAAAVKEPASRNTMAMVQAELGDVLFSVVNLARFLGVDAEEALRQTTNKFHRRFHHVEKRVAAAGMTPEQAGLAVMDRFWDEAKKMEAQDKQVPDE